MRSLYSKKRRQSFSINILWDECKSSGFYIVSQANQLQHLPCNKLCVQMCYVSMLTPPK